MSINLIDSAEYLSAQMLGKKISSCKNNESYFEDYWRLSAEYGLFDILVSEEKYCTRPVIDALIGLGSGCQDPGVPLSIGAHCFAAATALRDFGSSVIKDAWFDLLKSGKVKAAFAPTEEGSGSDVMSMKTSYIDKGDKYVINGVKSYITNAPQADLFIIFATKDARLNSRGISAFLVPRDVEGLSVECYNNIALKTSPIGKVNMCDVKVPKTHLIGSLHQGAKIFYNSLQIERALIFVSNIGIMQSQLNECIRFSKERRQFGKPIGSYQFVQELIVDSYDALMSSYCIAETLLPKLGKKTISAAEVSYIKLKLSESAYKIQENTLRIYGAKAFSEGGGRSSHLLDSLCGVVLSGTSEIQKSIIADDLGLSGLE